MLNDMDRGLMCMMLSETLNQTDGGHEALLHRRDHLFDLLDLGRDGADRRDFGVDWTAMDEECHEDGQVRRRQSHDLQGNPIKCF